jgi:hypothetical protein
MMRSLFMKLDKKATIISGLIAAICFSIPVYLYISFADYEYSWLVYMGSFLFMIVMWVHTIRDSRKRQDNESTVALSFNSHMATLTGVAFSCIFCFLLLVLFVPGYLNGGDAGKLLDDVPANMVRDKTDGLSFSIFMAATVINFSVGSFTGIILPFYLKRNQTRDSRTPTPLHNRGIG